MRLGLGKGIDDTGQVMNWWFLKVLEGYMAAISLFTKISKRYVEEYLFLSIIAKSGNSTNLPQ